MRLLFRATLLVGVPLLIMTGIGIALIAQGKTDDGRSTLVVGVIIAATAGSSVIYQIEHWSLTKQSLVHLGVMTVTVLPALLLSGWFALTSTGGYITAIGVFLATGAILWTVFYVIFGILIPGPTGESTAPN